MVTAIPSGTNAVIIPASGNHRIIVTAINCGIEGGIGHFATIAAFGTPLWVVLREIGRARARIVQTAVSYDDPIFVLDPGDGLLFNYTFGPVGTLADAGATFHTERVL